MAGRAAAQKQTEVDQLRAGGRFWLGAIAGWHKLGRYDIAEYYPINFDTHKMDTSTTHFAGWIDGQISSRSWCTLEQAIIGLIAIAYDGRNTQADLFFPGW